MHNRSVPRSVFLRSGTHILCECVGVDDTSQYVEGLSVKRSIDGELAISISALRITLKGLEYLHDNSMMRKAADIAKGIADIIP